MISQPNFTQEFTNRFNKQLLDEEIEKERYSIISPHEVSSTTFWNNEALNWEKRKPKLINKTIIQ